MKNTLLGLLIGIFVLFSISFVSPTSAQSIDDLLADILTDDGAGSDWGYSLSDKDAISLVGLTDGILTLEVPLAQKDNQDIQDYYVTWGAVSYSEIASSSASELLEKIQDSATYETDNEGQSVYEIKNGKLELSLPVTETQGDIYVTIAPTDTTQAQGSFIEDYKVTLPSDSGSQVLSDNYSDSNSDKALSDVSCLWTKDTNRVSLSWSVNTAMNADRVEIFHRPDLTQGTMDLKGTPNINDKEFTLNTPHRKGQLFRLKPIDSNGAMLGTEIMYTCRPAEEVDIDPLVITNPPITPGTPGIVVVPVTGPEEVALFAFLLSFLLYIGYRFKRS